MTEQIFALYSILFKDLNSERKALVLVDAHYDILIESGRDMLKHGLTVTASEEMPQLGCRFIYHVDAASIAKTSHMTAAWRKMVVQCLMKAEEMQLSSLAFPALGTGWLVI